MCFSMGKSFETENFADATHHHCTESDISFVSLRKSTLGQTCEFL